MRPLLSAVLAFAALPAAAEYLSLDLRFSDTGCASCVESLTNRLKRLRGVESATVDAASGSLHLELATGNSIRLGQVRERIEQDGTKVLSVDATVRGQARREGDDLLFEPVHVKETLRLRFEGLQQQGQFEAKPGVVYRIEGRISNLRPSPERQILEVQSAEEEK